jgi:hypothetical protein
MDKSVAKRDNAADWSISIIEEFIQTAIRDDFLDTFTGFPDIE